MEISNYRPRQLMRELQQKLPKEEYFQTYRIVNEIIAARANAVNVLKETNDLIDAKLKELKIPSIDSMILVHCTDPTVIVTLQRDISGEFVLKAIPNCNEYGPDVLAIKYKMDEDVR